jgi:teichuronic acid exporter
MSLKTKTFTSVLWSVLARLGQTGVGFLTTLVLTRLLSPVTFGLIGMVTVFTDVIVISQDPGLSS